MTPDQLCAEAERQQRGDNPGRAETLYRAALALDPNNASALYGLGRLLNAHGHAEPALALIEQAVRLKPRHAGYREALGQTLARAGRHGEAIAAFRDALRLEKSARANINLGAALAQTGEHAQAAQCFRRALTFDPTDIRTTIALAIACQRAGDGGGAEQALRRAVQLSPKDATLISDLAILLHRRGRAAEAAAQFDNALSIAPNDPKILARHAVCLRDSGDLAASEAQFRAAIAQAPDDPLLHYGLAFTLLTAGRLRAGFAEHEWRFRAHNIDRPATAPAWSGKPDPEGTLLITAEQGQGDVIQFLRYVPVAAQRMRIALEMYPPLHRLATTLPGVTTLLREGEPYPPHQAVCPLLSLPRALDLDETPLPMDPADPYLRADPQRAANWSARLACLPGRKIGLAWAGAPNFAFDNRRSIPPALLDSLALENISFVSLQKDPAATPNIPLTDHTADLTDFADTAALIANLDLVIAVDTAVAHLAGAIGKPVWLLNRFDADWRWGRVGETSAWYPTLRQFRQPVMGDWPAVIAAVRDALTQPPPPHTR
jgi:Flp pilus assembly protein TadD